MSTIRLPPNGVRSATIPAGVSTTWPMVAARAPSGCDRSAVDRGVGLVVRDHRDELPLVRHVDRVDAEHVAGAEDLRLHRQRLLVENDADTGGLGQLVAHGAESAAGGVAHPPRARCRGQQRLDHLGDGCGVGDDVVGLDGEVAASEHHGHPVVTQGPGEHQPVPWPDQVGAQLAAGRDHADAGGGDVQPVGRSLRDHLRVTGDDLHAGRVGGRLHVGDDRPAAGRSRIPPRSRTPPRATAAAPR